jgi:acetolactate synthase I/II/III large subunit
MKVSEYVFKYFADKGIDTAFAVTGSTAMWLFDALGQTKGLCTVCTNHEQAAAMAADGWARLKNKPGLVVITNGPGVTNAISGVAQAWTDSVPMIVVSGESRLSVVEHEISANMRQYGAQDVRTDLLAKAVTKHYRFVESADSIRYYVEEAYYYAMEGRPGPVWLDVPIDLQNALVPEKLASFSVPAQNAPIRAEDVSEVQNLLLGARKPLIVAGNGIRLAGAIEPFLRFIETYSIPVVTSRMGNDIIETSHPLFVGRPGNWGSRAAHFAIQSADVVLVLGSRLAVNTTGHSPAAFAPNAKKILVEIDPTEFEKPGIEFYKIITADIRGFLEKMLDCPENAVSAERRKWAAKCGLWKEKYPVVTEEYHSAKPMSTYHFIDYLTGQAKENDVILSDTGSCCNIVSQVWQVKKGQRILLSGGLSCMGYWATVMGASKAAEGSGSDVLCAVGDGSLQMNIQELGTISHYHMPVKLFVINNNGYQIIRISQKAYMHERYFGISPETGVGLANTEKIAEAYGIRYFRVEDPEKVTDTLREVMACEGPVICEAVVNEDQLMLPRLTSKVQPDGTLKSAAYEDLAPFLSEKELAENLEG